MATNTLMKVIDNNECAEITFQAIYPTLAFYRFYKLSSFNNPNTFQSKILNIP